MGVQKFGEWYRTGTPLIGKFPGYAGELAEKFWNPDSDVDKFARWGWTSQEIKQKRSLR
jgi:hypothetical protein